jgi:hypothetical protein
MSPEFLIVFEQEIKLVAERLENARAALAMEESRHGSEKLRIRIKYVERLLSTLRSSRNDLLAAFSAPDEMDTKFTKWSAAYEECRAAQDKMHAAEKQAITARAAVIPLQDAVILAEREVVMQKQIPLPRFATEPEIRRNRELVEQLEQAYAVALAKSQESARERDALHSNWIAAASEFDALCFKERMLRLPGEPAPYKGVGELNAVR